jgi:hypothetical protein
MPKVKGRVVVNGTLAYVPQTAWMKNDTLKENILFGKDLNPQWYNKVKILKFKIKLFVTQGIFLGSFRNLYFL